MTDRPRRIFHGPYNITGQASSLAGWQRKQGAVAEVATFTNNIYDPPGDLPLDLKGYGTLRRYLVAGAFFLFALFRYDIFHFYFGTSLLPLNLDLPLLKLLGKKVIMTYCGSEVRLVKVEQEINPHAHLLCIGQNHPRRDAAKRRRLRWQAGWTDLAFAPRSLYLSVTSIYPESRVNQDIWLHNALDLEKWRPARTKERERPVVVHAPSNTGIKGTDLVERVVGELKAGGLDFDYVRMTNVPCDEVHEFIRNRADIIVDQFLIADFGTLAAEGMSLGIPVIGFLSPEVKRRFYPDCPIVSAEFDELPQRLAELIGDPELRLTIGRAGRDFAERHFDHLSINKRVWAAYDGLD